MLMHFARLGLAVNLMLFSGSASASSRLPAELVGRWRAESVPTGYYVVDRYADGRYAMKRYFSLDSSKPAELTLEWGHWHIRKGKYSEIIEGTTSPTLKRFL